MKYNELKEALIGDGYENRMPPRGPMALIDGPAIDAEYADNEVKCFECGGDCMYEPWMQEGSYRALAVCLNCGEAIEF